jgi:hypothetical protein
MDRVGESVVNKLDSLNSIIKLSRSDLTNNGLFITAEILEG